MKKYISSQINVVKDLEKRQNFISVDKKMVINSYGEYRLAVCGRCRIIKLVQTL